MHKIISRALVGALFLAPGVVYADDQQSDVIIVTAQPNPEDPPVVAEARERLARTPGAVSVVSNESFENRSAIGLTDILRDAPGVLAQKRYGEESRFSIRGSGLDQSYHQRGVLFAQDGVPFADADGNCARWTRVTGDCALLDPFVLSCDAVLGCCDVERAQDESNSCYPSSWEP